MQPTAEQTSLVTEALSYLTAVDTLYNTESAAQLRTKGTSVINPYVWNSLR
jgi:hypothetical protein